MAVLLQPPDLARDLTLPAPGSTTAREVLSRSLARLLNDLQGAPHQAPPPCREEAAVLLRLGRASASSKKVLGAMLSAVRRPTLGGLIRSLRGEALPDRPKVYRAMTAQLVFELALAGVLPEPVRLRRAPPRLLSIPARLALVIAPGATGIVFENGSVVVEREGAVARIDLAAPASAPGVVVGRPYHEISGDIVLALADNNPLALVEAHPDKSGNAVDLGGRDVSEWAAALTGALDPIARHLPEIRAEMDLFVSQIVPVGWDPVRHLSASYQEIIGTLYLSLHPSRMTLSEALIHEFSHNKLNALFEVDDVLENAWSPLYTSPVRPDPRPLHGVLLAVHAFLPVARLYERMIAARDPEAQNEAFVARFAAVREINRAGAELVLAKGRPTVVGQGLFEEIRRWHTHYSRFDEAP
jgi:HEXXH motif-containing protein